jgi:DNA modification methylase
MTVQILVGDCRERLRGMAAGSVQTCVTSPPYFGLRDYGHAGQIGLEPTPDDFVAAMVEVFREVRRVLRDDGTVWLNLGDSYASAGGAASGGYDGGILAARPNVSGTRSRKRVGADSAVKPKELFGIPWRVAFALQADGWFLRQDIIWHKPNPMPESVTDRCTKAHEYIFLLSKGPRYFFDAKAIAEPAIYAPGATAEVEREKGYYEGKWSKPEAGSRHDGSFKAIRDTRNKRSVWTVASQPFADAHFATYPPDLIEPCILAGCPVGGAVLDPFGGAGTTGLVADRLGRNAILCELNPAYAAMAEKRLRADGGMFIDVTVDAPPVAIAAE